MEELRISPTKSYGSRWSWRRYRARSENHVAVGKASVAHLKLPIYQKGEAITTFLTRLERIAKLLYVDSALTPLDLAASSLERPPRSTLLCPQKRPKITCHSNKLC